jgi:hypothetical protein
MNFVIEPTLEWAKINLSNGMDSESAKLQLLATFCHESLDGTYLKQVKGPALGVHMVEPETLKDIERYITLKPGWYTAICRDFGRPYQENLITDMAFCTLIARIKYWMIPEPLPRFGNLENIANYWGKYYQTDSQTDELNKKEKQFIASCRRYAPEYFK